MFISCFLAWELWGSLGTSLSPFFGVAVAFALSPAVFVAYDAAIVVPWFLMEALLMLAISAKVMLHSGLAIAHSWNK